MRYLLLALLAACVVPVQDGGLQGAWYAEHYVLQDGNRHVVDGHIFFAAPDWTVLFFVLENGEPRRGSGEGGTFEIDGSQIVFHHRYLLAAGNALPGLPANGTQITTRTAEEATTEPCRFAIDGDALTLFFPSGNAMTFRR